FSAKVSSHNYYQTTHEKDKSKKHISHGSQHTHIISFQFSFQSGDFPCFHWCIMAWNHNASPLGFFSPAALLEFILLLLPIDELQVNTLSAAMKHQDKKLTATAKNNSSSCTTLHTHGPARELHPEKFTFQTASLLCPADKVASGGGLSNPKCSKHYLQCSMH
ncbi:hypothetical protein VIGAN_08325700, partial [Vigna angularis var. angularis]